MINQRIYLCSSQSTCLFDQV